MRNPGEVRLTQAQAAKVWDGMFATRWPEIFEGHVLWPLMAKLARAGYGTSEALDYVNTGKLDPTIGMPKGTRYQQAPEGTEEHAPVPDMGQSERMHQAALQSGYPVSGSL